MKVLGIDPGLQNTGIAIVESDKQRYRLHSATLIKTEPKRTQAWRLTDIYEAVYSLLNTKDLEIEAVTIEKVYHNINVSSSISTGKVIGACMVAATQCDIPVIELTPQQIKRASGLTLKEADKANLKKIARRIFQADIRSHHVADAAFCALAGILHRRATPDETTAKQKETAKTTPAVPTADSTAG